MKYAILLAPILFISAVLQNEEYKTHVDEKYNVSIDYPKDWTVGTQAPTVFVLKSPFVPGSKVTANMNLVVQELTFDLTPKEYAMATRDQMGPHLNDFKSYSIEEVTFGGVQYAKQIISHVMNAQKLMQVQYYRVEGRTVYILTYTCAPDDLPEYDGLFSYMTQTFHLN